MGGGGVIYTFDAFLHYEGGVTDTVSLSLSLFILLPPPPYCVCVGWLNVGVFVNDQLMSALYHATV